MYDLLIIYFFYNIFNEKNSLYQVIKDTDTITQYNEEFFSISITCSTLYSVIELLDGNLGTCNSFGIKLYKKQNNIYEQIDKYEFKECYIERVIGNYKNILIFYYINFFSSGCTYWGHNIYLSIFDFEKQEKKILNEYKWDYHSGKEISNKVFYKNDKYFIAIYGNNFDIYDIKINFKLINHLNVSEKNEKDIIFKNIFSDIHDNLLIGTDIFTLNLYKIKNGKIFFYKKTPIQDEFIRSMIKLRNDKYLLALISEFIILKK